MIYNNLQTSQLLNSINLTIANKSTSRGINRNNTDFSLILPTEELFEKSAPLSACFLFHTNVDLFISTYGLKATKYILQQYWEDYFTLILQHTDSLPRLSNESTTPKEVYAFFKASSYQELQTMLKHKVFKCPTCGDRVQLTFKGLQCISCNLPHKCTLCTKQFNLQSKLVAHYTIMHNLDYYELFPQNTKAFCPSCGSDLPVYKDRGFSRVHTCKNKNCIVRKEIVAKRKAKQALSLSNRSPEEIASNKENCRNAAYKREQLFKDTITSSGLTRKQEIALKSAKLISEKIKLRIAEGTFTPCVTNSWAKSRCIFNGTPYRSSFELMFKLIHKDTVEYETTRIKYYFENSWRNYIVDFTDHSEKILYEIKPTSELLDEKVLAKHKAADAWCVVNGYSYVFITEKYLTSNLDIIQSELTAVAPTLDADTLRKIKKSMKGFNK